MATAQITPGWLLLLYCVLILLASLAGGWIPILVRLTHLRLQLATSFVAGLMLGVGLLHMLPHASREFDSMDRPALWLLAGFLFMFFIQRFFHFHHHDVPEEAPEGIAGGGDHDHAAVERAALEDHHVHTLAHKSASQLSWGGAALGLGLHTIINGVALAASVEAAAYAGHHEWLLGIGTFLVIILHKPFDALAIITLMTAGGWSRNARHLVNGLFALIIPLGVLLFYLGAGQFADAAHQFLGAALAFAAGTFVCIAASDLLPELQFHSHDRIKLSCALLAGLALSAMIGQLEKGMHNHEEHAPPTETSRIPLPSNHGLFQGASAASPANPLRPGRADGRPV